MLYRIVSYRTLSISITMSSSPHSTYSNDIWSTTLPQPHLNRLSPAFIPRNDSSNISNINNNMNTQYKTQQSVPPPPLQQQQQPSSHHNNQYEPSQLNTTAYSTNPYTSYHMDIAGTPNNVNDIIGIKLPLFEAKYYINEKITHLYNMFHYRVKLCDSYINHGTCVYDNATCYDAHDYTQIRRIPRILAYSNGHFFSYNACRCQQYELEGMYYIYTMLLIK